MIRKLVALSVFAGSIFGQARVSPENLNTRLLCIVPMVGTGSASDPRRPMFAPSLIPTQGAAPAQDSGIISWSYELSDDGTYAIVEFEAKDRRSVANISSSVDARVKVFDRSKATKSQIETEVRKYKKNFDLNKFRSPRSL